MTRGRRAELADALERAADAGVSGEALAARLGVSRVAVAKHIAAMRAMGYRIEAVRGAGYRLVGLPDGPVPPEVERFVTDALWVRMEGGAETGSTNDDCKSLARAGAPEGTVVVAERQTAGRGRFGRTWISPQGGVYLSALLRPAIPPANAGALALAVALGISEGLESLGVRTSLKWPNDVLAGGAKVAGVLLEMSADTDTVEWVVAGCGVNVRETARGFDGAGYVSAQSGASPARVAAAILDGIAATYRDFLTGGFAKLADRYAARHALAGEWVRVSDLTGRETAAGTVLGLDADGHLLVQTPSGVVTCVSGEVTVGSAQGA